jgi:hypothetical protein
MALNAEALECRAAVVQLQQDARLVLNKAIEIEKRATDELSQQAVEMKAKQQEIERNRAAELEKRIKMEEERQRLKVKCRKQKKNIYFFVPLGNSTTATATRTFISNV